MCCTTALSLFSAASICFLSVQYKAAQARKETVAKARDLHVRTYIKLASVREQRHQTFHASTLKKSLQHQHVAIFKASLFLTMTAFQRLVLVAMLLLLGGVQGQRYDSGYDDYSQDNLYHDYAQKQQDKVTKG